MRQGGTPKWMVVSPGRMEAITEGRRRVEKRILGRIWAFFSEG